MTITIPPELVPLLRDGLYFDLHGCLDETSALVEPRDRGDIRAEVEDRLARAEATRRLLDVVGWYEPEEGPPPVEVDVREHRDALLRALLVRIGVERGVENDVQVSVGVRAEAKVRAGQLAALVQRVEEGGGQ
jgi:hypothetical protein